MKANQSMTENLRPNSLKSTNVFVLNTGRCGSSTLMEACKHISNYSCGHESRSKLLGDARFGYPAFHIEVDNRLSWFLGRLDKHYGDNARYVHLMRNRNDTARSYVRRYPLSIVKAYRQTMLMGAVDGSKPMSICLDYCDTINTNIELFLKDKAYKMEFMLENAKHDFRKFWEFIGAEGDIDGALAEFDVSYNAGGAASQYRPRKFPIIKEIVRKVKRLAINMPNYIKNG